MPRVVTVVFSLHYYQTKNNAWDGGLFSVRKFISCVDFERIFEKDLPPLKFVKIWIKNLSAIE